MIQKIKDLLKVKEDVDSINNTLKTTTESVNNLKEDIGKLREDFDNKIKTIGEKQSEFLKNFDENLDIIKTTKEGFEKRII